MTFLSLLLRNLFYHWRGNFAVLLGIVLGSAVLTGALLVGDSLRGSLKALTLDQLDWVENALVPGRFFRAALVDDIAADKRSAALLLQGSVSRRNDLPLAKAITGFAGTYWLDAETQRAGKATVLGVDASFWPTAQMPVDAEFWASEKAEVVLNQTLADALSVQVGDKVTLHLERADAAPREMILAQRKVENVIELIRVEVKSIIPDEKLGRFSLKPSPLPVRNAFVPIKLLQNKLDLAGRANAVLVAGLKDNDLQTKLTLDDLGLRYRAPKDRAEALVKFLDPGSVDGNLKKKKWAEPVPGEKQWLNRVPDDLAERADANGVLRKEQVIAFYEKQRDYYVLESQRMVLEPLVVNAVKKLEPDFEKSVLLQTPRSVTQDDVVPRWRLNPILVYLADSISDGKREVPYSIIASDNTDLIRNGKPQYLIADDEIMLMDWPGSPFADIKPGSLLTITYYAADAQNHLQKQEIKREVHRLREKIDGPRDDPDLTPEFRGVTDKLDMANWEHPPFPYDPKRVKKADDDYWKRYKTTPKAYVNLKKAQELWGTRFGNLTSIQVRNGDPEFFPQALLKELKPAQGGFVFQPVRDQAIQASGGTTDFGEYFLYFSFFLIVSALLLVGLLVRLNMDRRASEIGVLLATGWTYGRVRWLLLGEGAVLAVVGGLIGLGVALFYAHAMLRLLAANWPGGETLNFLRVYTDPHSFIHGFFLGLLVSLLTLWWALRVLSKMSPRALLQGDTAPTLGPADAKAGWSWWLIPVGVIGAAALAVAGPFTSSHETQALTFLGSGALLLTACLAGVAQGLKRSNRASSPQPTLTRLGLRNAGRHLARSVLTVGLLASASFLIVAVESFHKDTGPQSQQKTGGAGGFAFYAEGSVPVFEDLNQPKVRSDHGLDKPETLPRDAFFPCRVQAGDDASCLGLYKPLKPRVMGVPEKLIERGGFSFAGSKAESKAEKANPWLVLQQDLKDEIPAIVDANTAQWILKVGLGDTIDVRDEQGKTVKLRVVALLQDSIFQSEVLISEANFIKLFPQQTGFSFYLIDVGDIDAKKLPLLKKQLGKGFEDFGLDVETTASRLQGYLAVENTYLATFQALGGLGLILGAMGLAIVLLRGVWERRAELALLMALGFRSGQLAWLVLAENALLLALGLAAGTVSALLAVAPHLIGAGAEVLWSRIVGLLAIVLAVGLVSATLAVFSTLRTPVLTALRRE